MDVTVKNKPLSGRVTVPASKSDMHRVLICAALADKPFLVKNPSYNDDTEATIRCLRALGAVIEQTGEGVAVTPLEAGARAPMLHCGESGSTLRFLLPVAAVVSDEAGFFGEGSLPSRPVWALLSEMKKNGCVTTSDKLPLKLRGTLRSGVYEIPGNISSQFVSGLLIALPLLAGDSRIVLTSQLESAAYADMTLNTLADFGVSAERGENSFLIKGGQKYISPAVYEVEADWSSAAYFIAANALGGEVNMLPLNKESCQPDMAITKLARELPDNVDVSEFPDLSPILAVLACAKKRDTTLCGAARLRIKESDRLAETVRFIRELGGEAQEKGDSLVIHGKGRLSGGVTDSANDHRIAMAAGIAAAVCDAPVTVRNAGCVNKSYPGFWEEIARLSE